MYIKHNAVLLWNHLLFNNTENCILVALLCAYDVYIYQYGAPLIAISVTNQMRHTRLYFLLGRT